MYTQGVVAHNHQPKDKLMPFSRWVIALGFPITLWFITTALVWWHWIFMIPSMIYAFDIGKRMDEYNKLKWSAPNVKIFWVYRGSICQRRVVMAVFPESRTYYEGLGYRWYHILPDGWPRAAFTINWWRSFFYV